MHNLNKRRKVFTRRALVIAGLKSALMLTLVGRLYHLQILKSDRYKTFSDSNRIKLFLIPPKRGDILDRNGLPLATNRNYYRIIYDPEVRDGNLTSTIARLASLLEVDESHYQQMMRKIRQHNSRSPLLLYEHLTWQEVVKVEVNSPDLPGIAIDMGQIRHFPLRSVSPHVVGYLGPVSESDIRTNPLLNHPDFKVGLSGVEQRFEHILRGNAGVRKMEINAFGLSVRELAREPAVAGDSLHLTIDRRLQEFIGRRLDGESGSAVVIDIHNGHILAMVSSPGFDPNLFTYGISRSKWQDMMSDPEKPLINKSIANQYSPGSTFKMVTMLAALQEGINPETRIYCPGYMHLGRRRFNCWKEEGHGHMNMHDALKHSCNVYFYNISKRLDIDKIAKTADILGLGKTTSMPMQGERAGLIPTRRWKMERFGENWQVGDTLNVGIGQGYLLTTPVQLAKYIAIIASGKNVMPTITFDNETAGHFNEIEVDETHLKLIRKGLFNVVNEGGGTAFGSRTTINDFKMAGKTGTTQLISKKARENLGQLTKEQKRRMENHALFVGYAPDVNPRYAVSVVVEHGGGGSRSAAPVARDIVKELYSLYVKK